MKVMVTGAAGMVGRAVVAECMAQDEAVVGFDHSTLDIANEAQVGAALERERPDVLINCAAWTDVDGCEADPDRAQLMNSRGPELLAQGCRKIDCQLITISTDYVFDGDKEGFYTQRDQPDPRSKYGLSKLDGERRAQTAWARTAVVRSGYIFGPGGKNFLSTFVERTRAGQSLRAISDSFGTPTYGPDLARQLCRLARLDLPGVYHLVNAGSGASFEDFGRLALELLGRDGQALQTVKLNDIDRPAPRPRNSRLRCLLSEAVGLPPLPDWRDAVREFVKQQ